VSFIAQALAFLAQHVDLLEALWNAIEKGASKDSLKAAIKQAEIEASDAVMKEELGLPPA